MINWNRLVTKIEKKALKEGALSTDPYMPFKRLPKFSPVLVTTNTKIALKTRALYGEKVAVTFLEESLRSAGYRASVWAEDFHHFFNPHLHLLVSVFGVDPRLEIDIKIPLLEYPVWKPNHLGGVWTYFNTSQGTEYWELVESLEAIKAWGGEEI